MLPIVDINGHKFFCGCLPRVAGVGDLFPVFDEKVELIPESDWQEVNWARYVPEIMSQNGIGACNSFAACTALRVCRVMAGLADVRLSPGHLYGQINGGRDAGSLLGDALTALKDVGACTTDEVPELEWKRRNWPAGIEEVARKYRITEAWDCPTFAHLATAIQRGFVVDYGIAVGSNFDTDANGWVAEGKGRGGHAMCGVGLAKRTKAGKTQWGIVTANSWGTNWGVNGFGIVPASYFANELFTDGWAVRVAIDPSDEQWRAMP